MSTRKGKGTPDESEPKRKVLQTDFADMRSGQLMLIPNHELIRKVIVGTRKGCVLSLTELRQALAALVSADVTCPVTTSIFLRKLIESEWVRQSESYLSKAGSSKSELLPFWRVVAPGMPLYKKLDPAIQAFIVDRRKCEGIEHTN